MRSKHKFVRPDFTELPSLYFVLLLSNEINLSCLTSVMNSLFRGQEQATYYPEK